MPALAALQDRLAQLQIAQIVHRRRALIIFRRLAGRRQEGGAEAARRLVDPCYYRRRIASRRTAAAVDERPLAGAVLERGCRAAGDTAIFYRSWYRRLLEDRRRPGSSDKRWSARLRRDQRVRSAAARPRHADGQTLLPRHRTRAATSGSASALADPWQRHLHGQRRRRRRRKRAPRSTAALHEMFDADRHALGAVAGDRRQ